MTALTNRKQNLLDVLTICLLTLVIRARLILACKASPVEAASLFVKGIFGTKASFAEIFIKACPLILTGLGCAVAFCTGFFNIGAEGQFYVGAISATLVALGLPQVPGVVRIVLCMVVAFVCGGIWALIAAVFKTRFNISEIIVTIMLNYIVINFLGYAVRSFLMDPAGNVPQSAKIDQAAQLPNLITSTRFHAGIVLAFVLAAVVWFLMEKTTVGYELKAVGLNQRAGGAQHHLLRLPQRRPGRHCGKHRGAGHPEKADGGHLRRLRLYRRTHCPGGLQPSSWCGGSGHSLRRYGGGRQLHAAAAGCSLRHCQYHHRRGGRSDPGQRAAALV